MSKAFLSRYKEYIASYCNMDTAYLDAIIDMLGTVTQFSPINATSGNVLLQISSGPPYTQQISTVSINDIRFDYTENGVDVARKQVYLSYVNNTLSEFQDTWNLYSIATWNMISEEEAINIAYASSQSLTLKFSNRNGEYHGN